MTSNFDSIKTSSRTKSKKNDSQEVVLTGARNPYHLVELKLGKRINWKRLKNPRKLIEHTLKMPYEKLFDPQHQSPLYTDFGTVVQLEPPKRIKLPLGIEIDLDWRDLGDFFEEGTEFTDPIQSGVLKDCYLISAMASIAWARPYLIAQKTRATGSTQSQFVDMIEIYNNDGGKISSDKIEVKEELPVDRSTGNITYARSNEPGEIWPALYEKAYAIWWTKHKPGFGGKWVTRPDYNIINGGSSVDALFYLSGLNQTKYKTKDHTADEIYGIVESNCVNRKTFNPMVASTYEHATDAPDKIKYSDANISGNHAYSILGIQKSADKKYIVLRNPWGNNDANPTLALPHFTWIAWDAPYNGGRGWWRPIDLATNDGIFALETNAFKKYFMNFGLAKEI